MLCVGRGIAIVLAVSVYKRQIWIMGLRGIRGIGGERLVVGWSVVLDVIK